MNKQLKLYYSHKEIAQELGEEVSTIYYWEKAFKLRLPASSSGGRRFDHKNREIMATIKYLVRHKHLTAEGVAQALEQRYDTEERHARAMRGLCEVAEEIKLLIKAADSFRLAQNKNQLLPLEDIDEKGKG